MNTSYRDKLFTILFVLFSSSSYCQAETPVKIGVMVCITGHCSEWGTNSLKGIELAVEELNKNSKTPFKLVVEDSHDNEPARAISSFKKLVDLHSLKIVIGPTWTAAGLSLVPLIQRNKELVVISPSVGVKEFNESSSNIFNVWPHDEKGTRALAQYAFAQNWKNAAIFGSQDPWVMTQSDIFAEEFKKLDGTITARVDPLPGSIDLKAEALKIHRSNPDVIMLSHYQYEIIAKELRNLGSKSHKVAILMEKQRVAASEGALEGTVFALYEKPSENFSKAFKERFKVDPGITADTAYDAMMLVGKVVGETNSIESSKLIPALHSVRNYKGASGTFSIDSKGAVNKKPVLWRIKGSEYQPVLEK